MKLAWYSPAYIRLMSPSENSENYEEWTRKVERYKRLAMRFFTPCIIDRSNKINLLFDSYSHDRMLPFEYKKTDKLEDLMYERAHELSKRNEIIQFFWSGGVDSTAALLVLKDVCPKDQFFVQMTPTSIEENPLVWDKLVRKLDHKIYKGEHLYTVPHTKYLVVECGSADQLYNVVSTVPGHKQNMEIIRNQRDRRGFDYGQRLSNAKRLWYVRRRFLCGHKRYRFFGHSFQNQINLDNIQPFYDSPDIEQYFMNRILEGSLTYSPRGMDPNVPFGDFSPSGLIYKKQKQELRDILREFDKDMGDNLLGQLSIRPNEKSLVASKRFNGTAGKWSVMAITETGEVIHHPKDRRKGREKIE